MANLKLRLELDVNTAYFKESPRLFSQSTAWEKCSLRQKQEFEHTLNRLLLQINIQHEAITCNTLNCNKHNYFIRKLYNEIIFFLFRGR